MLLTCTTWYIWVPVAVDFTNGLQCTQHSVVERLIARTRDIDRRTVDCVRRADDTQHQRQTADRWVDDIKTYNNVS